MFDELQDETTKRILELDDTEFQKVDFQHFQPQAPDITKMGLEG